MREKNYNLVISSAILSLSIIIGCFIMQGDLQKPVTDNSKVVINQFKPLMTIKETADYLNISELQVRTIISTEESTLKNTGTYSNWRDKDGIGTYG